MTNKFTKKMLKTIARAINLNNRWSQSSWCRLDTSIPGHQTIWSKAPTTIQRDANQNTVRHQLTWDEIAVNRKGKT